MIRRTKDYILENKMINNHSTVLVALSGGADSVCLLLVLNEIKRQCADELDFALEAVHVEHGIRGAESREDARFASDLCERLNIPCHVHSVDVPQYAASHGLGLEEAARILRYEAFEKEVATAYAADQKQGNSRQVVVAVAHHMEDNAETVLFQMLRGSGAKGLSGMHPVSVKNGVIYIRPLLSATRAQIEEYLKENEADLAIVDIYMPGMNGIELLRWIRGDHRNLSVIMVTAATEIQTVAEALQLGIVDYLIKPFSFARFQEAVQKYLRKEDVLKHSHTANQTMLDQLLNAAPANLNFETQDLRKGLNQMTLDRVKSYLRERPDEKHTCESLSAALGLSKVTIRRYLNYLIEIQEMVSSIDYETGGRPRVLYLLKR